MGQKVNPVGLRLGINRGWDSVWYAKKKDFGNYLIEDFNMRKYIIKMNSFGFLKSTKCKIIRFNKSISSYMNRYRIRTSSILIYLFEDTIRFFLIVNCFDKTALN